MKFLVVGLGSMGKRRIRCLKAIGYDETKIFGFDTSISRNQESETQYGISTFKDFNDAMEKVKPDAMIISVPPDRHHEYMKIAISNNIHFFVEASVVDTDLDQVIENARNSKVVTAPSCTLLFHPAIRKIGDIIKKEELGTVSNVLYHSGQYLPDWHTYEKVSDYYVSNPSTGGGREIVPFELTWLTKVFGFPKRVCGNFRKTINIQGAEKIDDTYNFLMDYESFLASISVDVVSRYATRRLTINGDKKQLRWDWDDNHITIFDPEKQTWDCIEYDMESAQEGYNANIGENMYIDEIKHFIAAIENKAEYQNTLERDHKVLKLLYAIEKSDQKGCYQHVEE